MCVTLVSRQSLWVVFFFFHIPFVTISGPGPDGLGLVGNPDFSFAIASLEMDILFGISSATFARLQSEFVEDMAREFQLYASQVTELYASHGQLFHAVNHLKSSFGLSPKEARSSSELSAKELRASTQSSFGQKSFLFTELFGGTLGLMGFSPFLGDK